MKTIDIDGLIPLENNYILELILNAINSKHNLYDNYLFLGFPHSWFKDFYTSIIDDLCKKKASSQDFFILNEENKFDKSIPFLSGSLLQRLLKNPLSILEILIETITLKRVLLIATSFVICSIIFCAGSLAWENIYSHNTYSLFDPKGWVHALEANLLPNVLFSVIFPSVTGFLILLEKIKIDFYNENKSNGILSLVQKNNFQILVSLLLKYAKKNQKIIILIKDIETLQKNDISDLKTITAAFKNRCKNNSGIVIVAFSHFPSEQRMSFADFHRTKIFQTEPDINDNKTPKENGSKSKYLTETIKRLAVNRLETWNIWSITCLLSITDQLNSPNFNIIKFKTIFTNNHSAINQYGLLLKYQSLDEASINSIFDQLINNNFVAKIFSVTNNTFRIDKFAQSEILLNITPPIDFIFSCLWLCIFNITGIEDGYSQHNLNNLLIKIVEIKKRYKSPFPDFVSTLIRNFSSTIKSSGNAQLAFNYAKLYALIDNFGSNTDQTELLELTLLYISADIKEVIETSNNLHEAQKNIFQDRLHKLFSNSLIEFDPAKDSYYSFQNNYAVDIIDISKYIYFTSLLLPNIRGIQNNYKKQETIQNENQIEDFASQSLTLGGFNFATISFLPIISSLARLNKVSIVTKIMTKLLHGLRTNIYTNTGWIFYWGRLISLIATTEIIICIANNSKKDKVSILNYCESLRTDGFEEIVILANDLLALTTLNITLPTKGNIPPHVLSLISKEFKKINFILTLGKLTDYSYLGEFYLAKFLVATKFFDACHKHEKEQILCNLSSIQNLASPLINLLHFESIIEQMRLDMGISISLAARYVPTLLGMVKNSINNDDFIKSIAESLVYILQLSAEAQDNKLACKLLSTYIIKRIVKKNTCTVDDIEYLIIYAVELHSIDNERVAVKTWKFAQKKFNELSRPADDSPEIFQYTNVKIRLVFFGFIFIGKQDYLIANTIDMINKSEDSPITHDNTIMLLILYYKHIFTNKKLGVQHLQANLRATNDTYETLRMLGLIWALITAIHNKENTSQNYLAGTLLDTFRLFTESNYLNINPLSISNMLSAVRNTLKWTNIFREYEPVFVFIETQNRKRALAIFYRESLPRWMHEKQFHEIALSFYQLFDDQLSELPHEIIDLNNINDDKEKSKEILSMIENSTYNSSKELWYNIYLLKELNILARKLKDSILDIKVKKMWGSISSLCVDSLLNKIIESNTDKELIELINHGLKIIKQNSQQ